MKTTTQRFSIEDVAVTGDLVQVTYLFNDDWKDATLSFKKLKEFALDHGINEWCFDYCDDEPAQHAGSYDIDTYMIENLEVVAKCYLEANYNPFDKILRDLDILIADFNNERRTAA